MEISVNITRESVFRSVARRMEWVGTRSPQEGTDYSRVSLSEADRSLFHSLFDEAAMQCVDICRPFLKSVANTDESLSMTLSVTAGAEYHSLQMTIGALLSAHVLAQWQDIVSPERSASSYARMEDCTSKILAILYHHPAPARITLNN